MTALDIAALVMVGVGALGLVAFVVLIVLGARVRRADNPKPVEPYQQSVFQQRLQDPDATQRLPAMSVDE